MALEQWLLEFAEAYPSALDELLLQILKQSESAALTAVVASVASAYPRVCGETLLVLLGTPLFILVDRQRFARELHAPSRTFGLMPRLNSRNTVYEEERKQADALPHRHHDLESAISNLQLGPFAPRVYEVLDRHRAEVRPVEEQNEKDRIWRLALHRMDLRQYSVAEDQDTDNPEDPSAPKDGRKYFRLDLKAPEPDVKEMMDRGMAQSQAVNAGLGLLMWGIRVYGREETSGYDPAQWRRRLEEARSSAVVNDSSDEHDLGRGGPGFVAAVCVRDHWAEMTSEERDWCVDVVCSEVEREADHWNQDTRVQRGGMSADRPCAWVLPLFLGTSSEEAQLARVRRLFVVALTHPNDEVRWYAAWGIANNLWAIDRELTLRCVNALATEATLVEKAVDAEYSRAHSERRSSRQPPIKRRGIDEIEAEAAAAVRQRFFEVDGIPNDAIQTLDPTRSFGAEANGRILAILGQAPAEPAAIEAFGRAARTLVAWWDADDDRRSGHQSRQERNHEAESALKDLLERFLLQCSPALAPSILQPILDAIDRHPSEVHWLLLGLIGVEDRQPNTAQFWSVWQLFAERVRHAKWLPRIDDEHASGSEMMNAIFLGSWWKENVRHWRSLEGYAHLVHSLFQDLPASSTALDDYVRFLYHIVRWTPLSRPKKCLP